MVSVLALVPVALILLVNTGVAALGTRLFRVRLDTAWGAGVFVALFVPLAATLVTVVVGAVSPPLFESRVTVFVLFVLMPMAVGVTIDVFWMPAPHEVELPASTEE